MAKSVRNKMLRVFIDQIPINDETQLPADPSLTSAQALLHWVAQASEQYDGITGESNLSSIVFTREIISVSVNYFTFSLLFFYF